MDVTEAAGSEADTTTAAKNPNASNSLSSPENRPKRQRSSQNSSQFLGDEGSDEDFRPNKKAKTNSKKATSHADSSASPINLLLKTPKKRRNPLLDDNFKTSSPSDSQSKPSSAKKSSKKKNDLFADPLSPIPIIPTKLNTKSSIESFSSDLLSNYDGISLEELKEKLTPAEYVKLSIQRSLIDSPHQLFVGKSASVLHPDLEQPDEITTFGDELRQMVSSWIELLPPLPAPSCYVLLESQAAKYLSGIISRLSKAIMECTKSASEGGGAYFLNGRRQILYPVASSSSSQINVFATNMISNTLSTNIDGSSTASMIKNSEAEDSGDEMDFAVSKPIQPSSVVAPRQIQSNQQVQSQESASTASSEAQQQITNPTSFYATVDLLAEALIPNVKEIRRMEFLLRRIAEEKMSRRISSECEGNLENTSTQYDPAAGSSGGDARDDNLNSSSIKNNNHSSSDNNEDKEEETLASWQPPAELEAQLIQLDPSYTLQKEQIMRDLVMEARWRRVESMPKEKLEEFQLVSGISFAKPKGMPRFIAWLKNVCGFKDTIVEIPASIALLLNYMVYEHLRDIVLEAATAHTSNQKASKSSQVTEISSNALPLKAYLDTNLIRAAIAAATVP